MKQMIAGAAVIATLCGGSQAFALFVNGGFEAGNYSGWTVRTGDYNGGGLGGIAWNAVPFSSQGQVTMIGVGGPADPFGAPFNTPFYGNYMARLNPYNSGNHDVTQLSQSGVVAAADIDTNDNKYHLRFGWGAVLDNPSHPTTQNPFFDVEIFQNGTSIYHVNHQSSDPGWTFLRNGGPYNDPIYYASANLDIDTLALGDTIEVRVTAADCSASAHDGLAYVDGFGSRYIPPVTTPDAGSTSLLLGAALTGLGLLRRKLS